ncbi:cutinase [Diplocarpon mali]|nr:cutinase [Diplocarpon mali]
MRSPASLILLALPLSLAAPAPAAGGGASFGSSTQNAGSACKGMTLVFARGTTEGGNMGMVAGPPFAQALAKKMGGDLAVQGVEYPADVKGFLAGGDAAGSQKMATLVTQMMAACPNTKMGGQLVHNAATMLPPDVMAQVNSAVIFGDPMNGKAVGALPAAQTKVICHQGDNICQGGNLILQPHLTYGMNADEAATFAATAAGR